MNPLPTESSAEHASRQAALRTRLMRLGIVVGVLYPLFLLVLSAEPERMLAPVLIAFAGAVGLLLERGTTRWGFPVFVLLTWLAAILQSALRGGLVNPVLHLNLILILMCGWLMGLRYATWILVLSLGWVVLLGLAPTLGWTFLPPVPNGFGQAVAICALWLAGYFTMRMVFTEQRRHIDTIQSLEGALRKQLLALQSQTQIAQENEHRVAQLLKASPLPITVAAFHSGEYIEVNPAWERFYGYSKAEVLGQTSVSLGFWQKKADRDALLSEFDANGRIQGLEVQIRVRDGSIRELLLSCERFVYGERDCVLTMSIDITPRIQLENALKDLNAHLEARVLERTAELDGANRDLHATMQSLRLAQEELVQSEKLASLGRLVAGVAHELNTPVGNALMASSSIQADAALLSDQIQGGNIRRSELVAMLERLSAGADLTQRSLFRAAELITSFKQVAVDQASERRRDFDCAQVIQEVVETMLPSMRRQGIEVRLELEPGVKMDSFPGPLGQVIMNCVNNAALHAFEGRAGGCVDITLLRLAEGTIELCISDNGIGIEPVHLGRIFDPFFTTKMGRGGSGIGLSISHRIVTGVLGGRITVISTPDNGTQFTLTLPQTAPVVLG